MGEETAGPSRSLTKWHNCNKVVSSIFEKDGMHLLRVAQVTGCLEITHKTDN